jgi:hypothetical protein
MTRRHTLPGWLRWLLGAVAFLLVLYVFGFLVFSCGSEGGTPITRTEQG